MAKVIVTQQIPDLAQKLLEQAGHDVTVLSQDGPLPAQELHEKVKGADALLTVLTDKIDKALLEAAGSQLKVVANYAVGYDNIDLQEAKARNVVVTNTPGVLTEAVAEHSLALMFALSKSIVPADKFVREGNYKHWLPMGFLGEQLWGKTLGVVGLGRIGSFLAEMCYYGLKMNIIYNDMKRDDRFEMELKAEFHELPTLLKRADIVSINVPLLPETRHLIGKTELDLMKPTAILINTSRGPVVDEKALVEALKNKTIAGAGLDVYENEPKLEPGLAELENVVLTPHTASATIKARNDMAQIAAKNIIAVLSGQAAINPVK